MKNKRKYFIFVLLFIGLFIGLSWAQAGRRQSPFEKKMNQLSKKIDKLNEKMDIIISNQEKMFKEFQTTRRWIKQNR